MIHRQRADGTFAAPPSGELFAPSVDVAPGDFDGDGDVDVAASGVEDFHEVVRILDNDGAGELSRDGVLQYAGQRQPAHPRRSRPATSTAMATSTCRG